MAKLPYTMLAKPEHPLDKKADNARELGLDYEVEPMPEQEPVAWLYNGHLHEIDPSDWAEYEVTPLYKTPTINKMPTKLFGPNLEQILNAAGFYRRQWVGLTQEEVQEIAKQLIDDAAYCSTHFAIAIEAELRRKNNAV